MLVYIYVPSVAYVVLNGSLLEEASKHYFGRGKLGIIYFLQNQRLDVLQQLHNEEDKNDDLSFVDLSSTPIHTEKNAVEEEPVNRSSSAFANSYMGVRCVHQWPIPQRTPPGRRFGSKNRLPLQRQPPRLQNDPTNGRHGVCLLFLP